MQMKPVIDLLRRNSERGHVKSRVRRGSRWLVPALLMGVATQALAQPAQPTTNSQESAQAQAPELGGLQEIVVTAQRRKQNLQEVPLAVSSFSADSLVAHQITNTLQLARLVPNFIASNNVGQASANVYYIRGLGQTQSFPTFEPQVSTYVDDIYIGRQNANNFALFGVDQVQVLRGPQGTLFGRNSTGGAVVVTLKKPSDTAGGNIEVGYGRFNNFTGRASIDLPISSQFQTRTSIFGIHDSGYVENLTNGETLNATHNWGIREAFRILPAGADNIEWNVAFDYSDNNAANTLNFPGPGGVHGSDRVSYTGLSKKGGALAPYFTGEKANFGQGVDVKSWGVTSNFQASFDAGVLNLISGYRGLHQKLAIDFADSAFGPLVPYDQSSIGQFALAQDLKSYQLSQEIKWTGSVGDKLKYTAGLFYLFENNKDDYGAVANLGILFGLDSLPFPLGDEFTVNKTASEAAYAQVDYKFTPDLTFTLGGRFTREIKWLNTNPNVPGSGFTNADIEAAGYDTRLKANEFTPRVALAYQVNKDVMLFASATRGFQGGGWNGLAFSAETFNNFGPETVWSYEAGVRSQTPDHRVRLNLTGFYETVKDYQLLSDLATAGSFVTSNASDMRAYGLEAELTWLPVDALTLNVNLGLLHANYYNAGSVVTGQQAACAAAPGIANGSCGNGIVDYNGNLAVPSQAPGVTLAASAQYQFLINDFSLTPSVGVQWVAHQNVSTAGIPEGVQGSYALLDVGVTFAPQNERWYITAECRNCTSENYATTYLFGYKYYNYPGTWDAKIGYKF